MYMLVWWWDVISVQMYSKNSSHDLPLSVLVTVTFTVSFLVWVVIICCQVLVEHWSKSLVIRQRPMLRLVLFVGVINEIRMDATMEVASLIRRHVIIRCSIGRLRDTLSQLWYTTILRVSYEFSYDTTILRVSYESVMIHYDSTSQLRYPAFLRVSYTVCMDCRGMMPHPNAVVVRKVLDVWDRSLS